MVLDLKLMQLDDVALWVQCGGLGCTKAMEPITITSTAHLYSISLLLLGIQSLFNTLVSWSDSVWLPEL